MKKFLLSFAEKNIYMILLHVVVLILTVEVLILTKQNKELKNQHKDVAQIKEGDTFSMQDVTSLYADTQHPDSLSDKLLFVFTTHCPFCLKNISGWTQIDSLVKTKKINIAIIGIGLDEKNKLSLYKEEHDIKYNIYLSDNKKDFQTRNKISSVPQTILCSNNFQIKKIWVGALSEKEITEVINTIYPHKNF